MQIQKYKYQWRNSANLKPLALLHTSSLRNLSGNKKRKINHPIPPNATKYHRYDEGVPHA